MELFICFLAVSKYVSKNGFIFMYRSTNIIDIYKHQEGEACLFFHIAMLRSHHIIHLQQKHFGFRPFSIPRFNGFHVFVPSGLYNLSLLT